MQYLITKNIKSTHEHGTNNDMKTVCELAFVSQMGMQYCTCIHFQSTKLSCSSLE